MSPAKRSRKVARTLFAARIIAGVAGVMLLSVASLGWASVTVALTFPTNGSTYIVEQPASITLSATASAGAGYTVSKVEFFVGTTLVGTATTAPYSITWNNFPSGNYTLTAKATAIKNGSPNQTATSSAVNITITVNARPSITWTGPADGTTVGGPVTITASVNATDSDGTIAQVFFEWQDLEGNNYQQVVTQPPYATGVPLDLGCGGTVCDYWINSWAVDNLGGRSSTVGVYIHVRENVSPSVTLTSPSSNATFTAPASITLTANASDSDGTIAKVEFYKGATLITTLTAAPYTYNWTNVAAGSYSLTAVATDNVGATRTSAPVAITVNSAVTQIYYIHPDHLNTPRLIADSTGTTVWRWDQGESFGNDVPNNNPSGAGAFDFPLRFPGQYFDKETGLSYNYFRDYDSGIGRYVQSDLLGIRAGLNTYAYGVALPVNLTDPLGLWPSCNSIILDVRDKQWEDFEQTVTSGYWIGSRNVHFGVGGVPPVEGRPPIGPEISSEVWLYEWTKYISKIYYNHEIWQDLLHICDEDRTVCGRTTHYHNEWKDSKLTLKTRTFLRDETNETRRWIRRLLDIILPL